MNPLYEFASELKNRIAKGEINGYTALDLFYQHVTPTPEQTAAFDQLWDQRAEHSMMATINDPVPEPASEEPADGQTAVADSD